MVSQNKDIKVVFVNFKLIFVWIFAPLRMTCASLPQSSSVVPTNTFSDFKFDKLDTTCLESSLIETTCFENCCYDTSAILKV